LLREIRKISQKQRDSIVSTHVLTVSFDKAGKLGIQYDDDLRIFVVKKWANRCGFRPGQKIVEFMNRKVKTQKELRDVLRDADRSAEFQVRVETVSERRRSYDDVGGIVGDVGVTAKMESAFTKKSMDLSHQVVKFFVRLGVEDSSLISRWYVLCPFIFTTKNDSTFYMNYKNTGTHRDVS
jgi:hypothetical protein